VSERELRRDRVTTVTTVTTTRADLRVLWWDLYQQWSVHLPGGETL
jgi:hypothetical protein